jgi:hypothetical protein|tara:strand:+ start:330 stop:584 length:255 start_codon:yes stop_codon:yes gene_type:complete
MKQYQRREFLSDVTKGIKDRGKAFAGHATLNRLTLSKDRGRSLRHYSRLPPHAFCGNIPLGAELQECEIEARCPIGLKSSTNLG